MNHEHPFPAESLGTPISRLASFSARNPSRINTYEKWRSIFPGINTSRKFSIPCIPLIINSLKPTRINTSGNKDLKSIRINTSGAKDLKSFRINTSEKHGRGIYRPQFGRFLRHRETPRSDAGPRLLAPRTFICDNRHMPQSRDAQIQIAPATPGDVPVLLQLIRGLAEYEKLTQEVTATADGLHAALFGPRPIAEAILARVSGTAVGFAVFFHNFSTFVGRPGIYLEDLFVLPEHRGKGIGKTLLLHVAALANERGCGRFEWAVLDWNKPAIEFYRGLGARAMDEWTIYRLSGEPLAKVAGKKEPS
jgi:GNAT superfamily N-acetyltransferase